ncbi:MAG: class I SAM-dependent DNA methyltransferase [Leptospira sp.]|nr:class I SAM-dependent DNA methyltransferase [Leptospira sp.]
MAIKKSDLYSSIWAACDALRGGMDASEYKDYVLFMLFIKYISDKYGKTEDFTPPVIIPNGSSFKDMVALKGKSDIGDKINKKIISPLIEKNVKFARNDFPNFNDPNKLGEGPAMVDRLTHLIAIFENPELDFSNNRADNDDILGDAYEYLMRHFAIQSGRSKGQFYTPSEVSRVIAKVIGISPENSIASTSVYDPTCGSGSLLLKVAAEAGKPITLEGQELIVMTAGLARMNMILHNFPTANVSAGNTLAAPKFLDGENLRRYDYVVANPPFSDKTWTMGITPSNDPYKRFTWGEPPAKQGDYAYLLHIIRSMNANGKGACILPHGVLFRGNAESVIRKQLVQSGILKAIIGLPANLFFGTGIPACILVLDNENASNRKGILMIDASKGFIKDGNKNRLREKDIHRIVDTFRNFHDNPHYSRMVGIEEIANTKNDFNLNIPRYIDSSEPEDIHDIDGHLRGGIPEHDLDALGEYWKVMPGLRKELFQSVGRPGYFQLKLDHSLVAPSILNHFQFKVFYDEEMNRFDKWKRATIGKFTELSDKSHPKKIISEIAEELLNQSKLAPLIEAYDIYQHLMDYWSLTMQDDFYLIIATGWIKAAKPREIVQIKNKDGKLVWPETEDYQIGKRRYKSDLIPIDLIIQKFFSKDGQSLKALDDQFEEIEQKLAEMREEHGGEEGLLDEVLEGDGENQTIAAKKLKARIKEIKDNPIFADEIMVLSQYDKFLENQKTIKKEQKALQEELYKKIHAQYSKLKEEEVKSLVIYEKWMPYLTNTLQDELNRISQILTGRITVLADRYVIPMPQLRDRVTELTSKVDRHLEAMGARW